jgi:hypothetical protein
MNKKLRIALGSAALATGLALAGAAPASAQVAFGGTFPLPHGSISIGVGAPAFPVGGYAPYGNAVIQDPYYGWGFYYGDSFVPCQWYGGRWIVAARPVFYSYGYLRPYYAHPYYAHPYYAHPYRYSYGHHDGGHGHDGWRR